MILLDEQYDGEIISLKKSKNGIVTIKIQSKPKEGAKNGIFRDIIRKLDRNFKRSRYDNCNLLRNTEEENGRGNQGGRGGQAGEKSQAATAKLMKAEAAQKKAMEKAQTEAAKLLNIQGGKTNACSIEKETAQNMSVEELKKAYKAEDTIIKRYLIR